jgi:hypothetical protein
MNTFILIVIILALILVSSLGSVAYFVKIGHSKTDLEKISLFIAYLLFCIMLPVGVLGFILDKYQIQGHYRFFVLASWILPTACFIVPKFLRKR